MPANPPYFPAKKATIATWASNFSTLLTAAPTTYGLTAGDATDVAAANAAFQTAYTAATTPTTRTPVTIASMDAALVNFRAITLPKAASISANGAVDNSDKTAIGVTVRVVTPTPIPAPATQPIITPLYHVNLETTMQHRNPSAPTSKKKPYGVVGLQVFVFIGAVPGTNPSQATIHLTVTKSPFRVQYPPGSAGQMATVWTRYINKSGPAGIASPGPWNAPNSFIIT